MFGNSSRHCEFIEQQVSSCVFTSNTANGRAEEQFMLLELFKTFKYHQKEVLIFPFLSFQLPFSCSTIEFRVELYNTKPHFAQNVSP